MEYKLAEHPKMLHVYVSGKMSFLYQMQKGEFKTCEFINSIKKKKKS